MKFPKTFGWNGVLIFVALFAIILAGGVRRTIGSTTGKNSGDATLRQQLIGRWRVVSLDTRKDAGSAWEPEYGAKPVGYIQYDANGRMSVQWNADPPAKKFASGDDENPTADEAREAYLKYVAYFGTYTLDEKNRTVTHHVESIMWPGYIGSDQVRPFVLAGNRLIITVENEYGGWRRVFEKAD